MGKTTKINPVRRCLLIPTFVLLLVACGGGSQTPAIQTQIPIPTDVPTPLAEPPIASPTPIPSSTPTSTPAPIPTPTSTPAPVPTPTSTPAPVPTPTSTPAPIPTPTSTPAPIPTPTSTPTPVPTPTSTPTPTNTTVDDFGFKLTIDGGVTVESSGLSGDVATPSDGIIFFEYGGANSILLWLEDRDSAVDAVLGDSYTSLITEQPDITFSLTNEGDETVDSLPGKYLTFITGNASGESNGGIIGSWRCPAGTVFSLTVTGSDPIVVNLRFKRLIDGFSCA